MWWKLWITNLNCSDNSKHIKDEENYTRLSKWNCLKPVKKGKFNKQPEQKTHTHRRTKIRMVTYFLTEKMEAKIIEQHL